jgi:hypothetical protein
MKPLKQRGYYVNYKTLKFTHIVYLWPTNNFQNEQKLFS